MTQSRLATVFTRVLLAAILALPMPGMARAQATAIAAKRPARTWPLTRPEATNYAETSRYDDVITFMKAMAAASPQIHLTTYGYTFEGRPMPLAVVGAPDASPEAVLATGKTRVFIQANIHAGEVEGKEAALWLLRSLAKGERASWLKDIVLLITPIYNADGNERVNVRNRGAQYGPVGGMGQRANAQDLDLNRDGTKMESPEARSMARLMSQYHPQVSIDLHTTDGSDHGYYLTYEIGLNPNTSQGITSLLRNDLLPAITSAVKARHGWDFFYYGGAASRQGERAWWGDLDLYKPRYTHTYFGIRNSIGILSETYSYATFEDRIKADYWFLEEILNYTLKNGNAMRQVVATADAESIIGTQQMVRGQLVKLPGTVNAVLADTRFEPNPYVADRPLRLRVNGSERVETMPHYGTVQTTETSLAPRAYVIPAAASAPSVPSAGAAPGTPGAPGMPMRVVLSPSARMMASVIDRLTAHGIKFFITSRETTIKAERFRIETSQQEAQEFQGTHKLRTLTGAWQATDQVVPAGSLVVPMDQPLARLAFILFDARSDDGFMAWNILDAVLGATPAPQYYPVLRTMDTIAK
ncbi:MAG TPA: M14 family zinc carboxypeptidase [Gemmatimonadaceae bacterium]